MTSRPFFICEVNAYKPGVVTLSLGYAHGTHPHGALSQTVDNLDSPGALYASDTGYRTLASDPAGVVAYPPIIAEAFSLSRSINLGPGDSGVAAAWGALTLSNAGGQFDAIAGAWNADGRAVKILYGNQVLEDFGGYRTTRPGAASYVNAAGSVVSAAAGVVRYDWSSTGPNLLPNSGTLGGFVPSNVTQTTGSGIAADGTLSGVSLIENTINTYHFTRYTVPVIPGAVGTLTIDAKVLPGGRWLQIGIDDTASTNRGVATFNLATGTVSWTNQAGTATGLVATITPYPLAPGWYRCRLTSSAGSASATARLVLLLANAATGVYPPYPGDGVSGVLLGRVQFEASATATAYSATGVPRLLQEYAATNLLTYSEQFDNAAWTKTGATITADAATAPDGTSTADLIAESATTNFHFASRLAAITAGAVYSFSVHAKQGAGSRWLQLGIDDGGANGSYAVFDLVNGVITGGAQRGTGASLAGAMAPLSGGTWRCTVTSTAGPVAATARVFALLSNSATAFGPSYLGDGASGVYVWGAQFEIGSPTSYIKTVAAAATRAGEECYQARGIWADPSYTTLIPAFIGVAKTWLLSERQLQIPLRDATYWLERPLQPNLYQGTGAYEGPVLLTGQAKPKARGGTSAYPIRNISPVLIDPTNRIYQYSDAAGTVVALYEGGNLAFTNGGNTTNLYAGSTAAGQYRTDNSRGLFQLGSVPVRTITADVTGEFPIAGAQSNVFALARYLLTEDILLPVANLNAATFTAAATAYAYTGGIYFGPEEDIDGAEAVGRVLTGIGAKLWPARDGTLRVMVLRALPAFATASAVFTIANTVSVVPRQLPSAVGPPPYRMRVGYAHNYTTQTSDISASATDTIRKFIAHPDRFASWASSPVLLAYRRPNDPKPLLTSLQVPADAAAVAADLGALWGTRRRLYDVTVPFSIAAVRDLGDIVTLVWPMDDLASGRMGQIVGDTFRSSDATITFQVLV